MCKTNELPFTFGALFSTQPEVSILHFGSLPKVKWAREPGPATHVSVGR